MPKPPRRRASMAAVLLSLPSPSIYITLGQRSVAAGTGTNASLLTPQYGHFANEGEYVLPHLGQTTLCVTVHFGHASSTALSYSSWQFGHSTSMYSFHASSKQARCNISTQESIASDREH